jgi:exodeoxyribonuclease V gamma subunit
VLQLHRAERADRLVDALAEILAKPQADPFTRELVAVPARGIERWLTQELSGRLGASAGRSDGVAANIAFPFPANLVGRALAAAGELDPDEDPWVPARLVWPLLEELETGLDEPWLATLRRNIGADGDPLRAGRRFAAARHIADLYDRYGVHRPAMVRAWAKGDDVDGVAQPIGETDLWQPRLWRRLRERLHVASPAERLLSAVDQLRDGLVVPDLPERVAIFGLTALPTSYVDVLAALGTHHDVHLLLLHPSAALWTAVAKRARVRRGGVPRRDDDRTREAAAHPLLASWGRDAREMQLVLAAAGAGDGDHRPTTAPADTLLQRLQRDLRDNIPPRPPRADELEVREPIDPGDRSVQVHACHGRTRQVEVLRDAILHLLADDPTLEPRDILVMCPDIETFAPLVSAVFGAEAVAEDGERPDGALPDLRVRLADRAIRQTNPVLRVVAELLTLADARLTASELLDLASREPVRRRFRLDEPALEQLESWVAGAGIRWGLDAEHRAAFGLGEVPANTWRAGLDRLLLGVAMPDEHDRLVGGICPLDDVAEQMVPVAGRLAELMERLEIHLAALRRTQTVGQWRDALLAAAAALTETRERDDWQRLQLARMLDDVVAESTLEGRSSPVALSLAEVRALLDDRLRGRPTRANHRTGDLTVCTLVPMRSVPHRAICLLGLDEGTFPRRTTGDGDDLLDRDPYVGDRDARTEDRQLLLDALMAAGDALVVTYTGRNERTNEPQPPAVPVGELLDVIDRTVRGHTVGTSALEQVVVEHPLQPFDPRNFMPGKLGHGGSWRFDATTLAGAQALAAGTRVERAFLTEPLEPLREEQELGVDGVVGFLEHPVRTFLRRRLDVYLPDAGDETRDAIPVELDNLERWQLGDTLLRARLRGDPAEQWTVAERVRGSLPPGALADAELETVTTNVDALLEAASSALRELGEDQALHAPRGSLDIGLELSGERRLIGTVAAIVGDTLVDVRYSKLDAKHRLGAWVRLLAATAMHPQRPLRALTVGRCRGTSKTKLVSTSCIEPLGDTPQQRQATARALLDDIVALYDRGMCEPLPLYCRTSAAWAEAEHAAGDPEGSARKAWITTWNYDKEDRDPYHQLVYGGVLPLEDLPDEWTALARRLWSPLLEREDLGDC